MLAGDIATRSYFSADHVAAQTHSGLPENEILNGILANAFSVDVEDYFQVSAFEGVVARDQWHAHKPRVEANTMRILELLGDRQIKATFFILGWVANKAPGLIREIAAAGHEIGSHGMEHTRVTQLSREQFRSDIRESKSILEELSGKPVAGYRAPSYSITTGNFWAFEELEEQGYKYSSSVYPVKHDLYGIPGAPRFAFLAGDTNIVEIPVSTVSVLGRNLPAGGGGFFRFYPYALSRWAIRRINRNEGQPTIFYCHPWEVDPGQPRITGASVKTRLRHYLNLGKMEHRLGRLLDDFPWAPMAKVYARQIDGRRLARWRPPGIDSSVRVQYGGA